MTVSNRALITPADALRHQRAERGTRRRRLASGNRPSWSFRAIMTRLAVPGYREPVGDTVNGRLTLGITP